MRLAAAGLCFAVVVGCSAAQRTQTYTGTITDEECGAAGHAAMQMGPTDAECTRQCVLVHGARYVLLVEISDQTDKAVYVLSDQATSEGLAGQRVRVVGTLDPETKTIEVDSMVLDD